MLSLKGSDQTKYLNNFMLKSNILKEFLYWQKKLENVPNVENL